ncbi:helix-turn-helix domain-containing protein [Streptomyces sp. NBC_00354]|uniref:helix-turn-helix domain-containing protein n=1 Tax=Streptomyces sp. NBC_00354 TaxID=2975723 RepID=UPI002E2699B2
MSNGGFAARLHALRTGAGLSQEELAQAAGVSVRALSDLERGRSRGPQRRTVQALATALGLDGPAAAELEHTASLGRPRPGPAPEAGPATQPETQPVPHHPLQLPRDLGDFTARGSALNRLRALAEHLDPAHPPVAVVSGQPGLGKTAFAVHAAHTLTPHFPHGQYAIDLRGMDPQPTPPRDALARLLRALGAADNAIPTTTEDRSGLLRSLPAEKAQWLAALGRAQARGLHQQVIDTAEAMHWFSDRTPHWEAWAQVFQWAVDSARALGSKRDEAVHLNYLAWAYNMCLYDHTAALATAQAALAAARESGDQLQIGWALGYAAGALHRLGRTNESITWLHEAADHLGKQSGPESRLAELTALNSLGQQLRQTGRAQEALAIHRRSEAICHTGVPGKPQELIGLYLAVTRRHIGNDLAALNRWNEAEHLLRYVLTHFQAAQMPAWSEPARLDLGIVLLHLNRHHEAHTVLTTAHDALVRLNNPRKSEAADHLHQLHPTCDVAPDSTG